MPTQDLPAKPVRRRMSTRLRHTLELGPVAVFLVVVFATDIFVATAVMMPLVVLSTGIAFAIERRVPPLIAMTCVLVLVFGGLTLILRDEFFIKIRPTIYHTVLAILLVVGLWRGKIFLKIVFEMAFRLDDEGWRKLTWRMAGLFLLLAVLNHLVWTNFSTEFWASYKLWGVYPIMFVFMIAQMRLIERHQLPPEPEAKSPDS